MATPSRAAWRLYLAIFICALLIVGGGLSFIMAYSQGEAVPKERYYRAVFVLQSLGGPAAEEREDIPGQVPYADATESLLHHPDKIFVLNRVAEELSLVHQETPKAALFEAYARLGLGDRREAVRLLTSYVVDADYDPRHYALLSQILYELGDSSSLLLICREWHERDASCRPDRLRFTWAALYNLERYSQAAAYMSTEGKCLGWPAQVYAAKSVLASGEEHEAGLLLETALKRHAQDSTQILRLWNQLKGKDRV